MSKYLITGVSSGVGRELAIRLVSEGNNVVGIARRKVLLQSLQKELASDPKFRFIDVDVSKDGAWKKIIKNIRENEYYPDTVIFNAAIFEKDYLGKELEFSSTKKMLEVNFISIIEGFEEIVKYANKKTKFIFISSTSALKGSGQEGVGYPASKAALSIAFESLYQKYRGKHELKIIFFGPINTGMLPTKSIFTPTLSKSQAVSEIIKTIKSKRSIRYAPWYLFVFIKTIKLLPDFIYLTVIQLIDILHRKSTKK